MLNDNKKEVQLLRSECATLEHHATETTNDILKEIIEDIGILAGWGEYQLRLVLIFILPVCHQLGASKPFLKSIFRVFLNFG